MRSMAECITGLPVTKTSVQSINTTENVNIIQTARNSSSQSETLTSQHIENCEETINIPQPEPSKCDIISQRKESVCSQHKETIISQLINTKDDASNEEKKAPTYKLVMNQCSNIHLTFN